MQVQVQVQVLDFKASRLSQPQNTAGQGRTRQEDRQQVSGTVVRRQIHVSTKFNLLKLAQPGTWNEENG